MADPGNDRHGNTEKHIETVPVDRDLWTFIENVRTEKLSLIYRKHGKVEVESEDCGPDLLIINIRGDKSDVQQTLGELVTLTEEERHRIFIEIIDVKSSAKTSDDLEKCITELKRDWPEFLVSPHDSSGQEYKVIGPKSQMGEALSEICAALGVVCREHWRSRAGKSRVIHMMAETSIQSEGDQAEGFTFKYRDVYRIHVFQGDITGLCVSVIVNAANEKLDNTAGVAAAISVAAGPELDRECREFVQKHGQLKISRPVLTQGYKLPAAHVLHVLGPRWPDYTDKKLCMRQLNAAFSACLETAEDRKFTSIAIPAVSSGLFGVPGNAVAHELYDAVMTFLHSGPSYLEEILLVDINSDLVKLMQLDFTHLARDAESGMKLLTQRDYERFIVPRLQENWFGDRNRERRTRPPVSGRDRDTRGYSHGEQGSGMYRSTSVTSTRPSSSTPSYRADPQNRRTVGSGTPPPLPRLEGDQGLASFRPKTTIGNLGSAAQDVDDGDGLEQSSESDQMRACQANTAARAEEADVDEDAEETKGDGLAAADEKADDCCICMCPPDDPVTLSCKHSFCKECIDGWFREKPTCPSCGQLYGKLTGDQPGGKMSCFTIKELLPGHESDSSGSIVIKYQFNGGKQGSQHPNPGQWYRGTSRTAFLPDSKDGREILELLKKAFTAKLVFTIGRSATTGDDDRITWNDIHHKSNMYGGPNKYGYPDPTYLARVRAELADKGIKS